MQFQGEAIGAEFADAYATMRVAHKSASASGDYFRPESVAAISDAMRQFIGCFLLPVSHDVFQHMILPYRVLIQMIDWTAELYGSGVSGRPSWAVFRILVTLEDHWDHWLGQLALNGVDPRRWDLNQLLAAFEVTLQQGAKDEADWRRTRAKLYAAPREERTAGRPRTARPEPRRGGMTLESAQALIGSADAEDALFG